MAGHVRMERERGGHLGGRGPGFGPDVEEDVAARRIAESCRHRSDGSAEAAVVCSDGALGLHRVRSGAHGG